MLHRSYRRFIASLPTAAPTTVQRNGVPVLTNATQSGNGALDLDVIQGDIL